MQVIEDVPFRVTGMTDEGIELAISGIKEIIAGQRIKTVLINMKQKQVSEPSVLFALVRLH